MYYVPDGTKRCGYYECVSCQERFLDERTDEQIACPYCGEVRDMELGPGEAMPEVKTDAHLRQIIEGEEEVKKYDTLLSLAVTGGDYQWI